MNITLYLQAKVTMIHAYTMGIVNCFQLLCQLCPFYCGNVRHVAKVRMSGRSVLFLQWKLWHLPQVITGLFLDLPQERPTNWALIWSMSRGIIYSQIKQILMMKLVGRVVSLILNGASGESWQHFNCIKLVRKNFWRIFRQRRAGVGFFFFNHHLLFNSLYMML